MKQKCKLESGVVISHYYRQKLLWNEIAVEKQLGNSWTLIYKVYIGHSWGVLEGIHLWEIRDRVSVAMIYTGSQYCLCEAKYSEALSSSRTEKV